MERAFQIGIVCNAIMKDVTDFERILEMRLINKAFNSACLGHLRKSYTSVTFSMSPIFGLYLYDENRQFNRHLSVNGMDFKYGENEGKYGFQHFSWFLRCIAKIRVKRLEVTDFSWMDSIFLSDLHGIIIRDFLDSRGDPSVTELIGMYNLCPQGCRDCLWVTQKCHKYGPIQKKLLGSQSRLKSRHLQEIHVSDISLAHIAQNEDSQLLIPSVTCDNLVITIFDSMRRGSQAISIDVLKEIMRKWAPKTIEIKVNKARGDSVLQYTPGVYGDWRMDEELPRNLEPLVGNPLAQIKLDISNSQEHSMGRHENEAKLFISNILKLFPTRELVIISGQDVGCFNRVAINLNKVITPVWNATNLTVNVQMFPLLADVPYVSSPLSMVKMGNELINIEVQPEQLRNGNLIGCRTVVRRPNRNLIVNVTWWVDKVKFEEYFHQMGRRIE